MARLDRLFCSLIAGSFLLAMPAPAQHQHHQPPGVKRAECSEPALTCASAATPFLAPDGRLWLTWAAAGRVSVAHSDDHGATFSPAVAVDPKVVTLDTGPDSRPKIVVDGAGRVTVAYALFKDQRYNGQVLVTRSIDGGRSFTPPHPITADPVSQRFETLALDADGGLFAAWIDKRGAAAARKKGEIYAGAALAFAWAGGDTSVFDSARIAQEQTCECCRIAVAFAGPGRPVVLFRNAFGGKVRDHATIAFTDRATPGPLRRVSDDDWAIDACPHHGPTLSIAPDGRFHAAWFTDGKVRQGLFYAHSADGGAHYSAPMPIGDPERQPARPTLLADRDTVLLAWKEFDGERSMVELMQSADGGKTWSKPVTVARTTDASDHPLLVSDATGPYLSWLTQAEGYRLLPLRDHLAKGRS